MRPFAILTRPFGNWDPLAKFWVFQQFSLVGQGAENFEQSTFYEVIHKSPAFFKVEKKNEFFAKKGSLFRWKEKSLKFADKFAMFLNWLKIDLVPETDATAKPAPILELDHFS